MNIKEAIEHLNKQGVRVYQRGKEYLVFSPTYSQGWRYSAKRLIKLANCGKVTAVNQQAKKEHKVKARRNTRDLINKEDFDSIREYSKKDYLWRT